MSNSRFIDGIYSPREDEHQVKVLKNDETHYVGTYETKSEAEAARDEFLAD